MNRLEFMTKLASLLQDVPVEERKEAMQYYNDYFDDAGPENEQQVITELESPEKVAENLKADLKGTAAYSGEFTETGYHRTEFDDRSVPARKGYEYQGQTQTEPPRTSKTLKVVLIIAIILVAAPIVIPLAIALAAVVIGCVAAAFGIFVSVVVAAIAVAVSGVILVVKGLVLLAPHLAAGLCILGIGLILTVVGTIGAVASIKLCMVVFPKLFCGLVAVCRKPFERKAVS